MNEYLLANFKYLPNKRTAFRKFSNYGINGLLQQRRRYTTALCIGSLDDVTVGNTHLDIKMSSFLG